VTTMTDAETQLKQFGGPESSAEEGSIVLGGEEVAPDAAPVVTHPTVFSRRDGLTPGRGNFVMEELTSEDMGGGGLVGSRETPQLANELTIIWARDRGLRSSS